LEKKYGNDYATIEAELNKEHGKVINTLQTTVEKCADHIQEYRTKKEKLFLEMRRLQGVGTQTTIDLLARIDTMESECAEIKPEDLMSAGIDAKAIEEFKSACKVAREKIEALKKNTLEPLLKLKEVPEDMDLDSDVRFKLCPTLPDDLDALKQFVEKAEKQSEAVLKVRVEFMKALKDMEEPALDAHSQMMLLSKRGVQVIAKGVDAEEIGSLLKRADELWNRLEAIQAAAKDADAYRSAAKEYLEVVEAAKDVVEKGEDDLNRVLKDQAERQALMDILDNLSGEINAAEEQYLITRERFGSVDDESPPSLTGIHSEIHSLRVESAALPIPELKEKVEMLQKTEKENLEKLQSLKDRAADASKNRFAALKNKWGAPDSPKKAGPPPGFFQSHR